MSQQQSVWSFFEKPSNCNGVDEKGEKDGVMQERMKV